ncbi:MAG TPA: hypothetical protein VIL74_22625 [Pyrinomonadaceae bacterium]|jgi:DNA-binding transcriptional regulator of glucitol operon
MKRKILLAAVILLAALIDVSAQENNAERLRTEVKKLDGMVGQWRGSGWIQQGAARETFAGTETVQRKLDGLALLVEGRFTNPEGKVIHETLAVLDFNDKDSKYRFRTYLATGRSGEHELKLLPDAYEWGFQSPMGTIRYNIKTANDVWFETGEFSKDGKTWIKFFEMKLDKVK